MTFEEIYVKYNKSVFRFINYRIKDQLVVEELTSDVMIKVYKNLDKYNENLSQIQTWIFNIAKNSMIDYFRKKKLNTVSMNDHYNDNKEEYQVKISEFNPEEILIDNENKKRMFEKFDKLSKNEKLVASLYFFDGLSYDEISKELDIPLGTVKVRVHTARNTMMESIQQ